MTRTAPPRTTRRPTSGPDSALDSEGTARTLDGGPGAIDAHSGQPVQADRLDQAPNRGRGAAQPQRPALRAQALGEATITLELDENLALDGYPGMKRISWLTSIKAGDNRLTLPLRLQDDNNGVITFAIESGGRRKQMMFTVQPSDQGANTQVI